jgi:ABC-type transporter Mla maintaining outer membrane lipid asymmetry ATPase subunit MlaF
VTAIDVEKQYGMLRPLRVRDLRVPASRITMLIGFDRPAAEVFVNLITGAALPDRGEIASLGRLTRDITDGDDWLSFVERFGIVSDRVVLLEAMTIEQNIALSFDLQIEPVPASVVVKVRALAAEVSIEASMLDTRVAEATPLLRSRVYLARALALDPVVLLLEHPTASLSREDATEYAAVVREVGRTRGVTIVGLLMDERFAEATGGRLLFWQPATGELRERSVFRFW